MVETVALKQIERPGFLLYKDGLCMFGIRIIKIRWSWDCIVYIMVIPILIRHIYTGVGPRLYSNGCVMSESLYKDMLQTAAYHLSLAIKTVWCDMTVGRSPRFVFFVFAFNSDNHTKLIGSGFIWHNLCSKENALKLLGTCLRTRSALVQVMAYHLFGAKQLSEPMLTCCEVDRQEHIQWDLTWNKQSCL